MPERFVVQAGEGKVDAGLSKWDDAASEEVVMLVQFYQVAGDIDEWRGDDATGNQIQHSQQQERLVRRLAFGGVGPGWAGARLREAKCLMEVVRSVMVFDFYESVWS